MPLIVPLIKKFEWLLLYLSLLIINLVLLLFVLVLFCTVQGTFVVNKSWEHTRCSRGSTSKHNRINLPLLFWILIRLIQNGIARCKDFTLITGMWGDFIAYGALKGSIMCLYGSRYRRSVSEHKAHPAHVVRLFQDHFLLAERQQLLQTVISFGPNSPALPLPLPL